MYLYAKHVANQGDLGGGNVFIRRNLVKSGTVFTQAYFTIYCVIKAFIIDLHVKKNSQHIQGGPPPLPERNPDNIDISNIAVFAWDLYILGWMEHC